MARCDEEGFVWSGMEGEICGLVELTPYFFLTPYIADLVVMFYWSN